MPMITKVHYEATVNELGKCNLKILDTSYMDQAFGSWHITIDNYPNIRLVWDGKDKTIRIDKMTNKLSRVNNLWKTMWSKVSPVENDLKEGVLKMKEISQMVT